MPPLSNTLIIKIKVPVGVIFLWGIISVCSFAQNHSTPVVQLAETRGSSTELIRLLETKSGWVISYSSRLCLSNNINLKQGNRTLLEHLETIFADCPFNYIIRSQRIILTPGEKIEPLFVVSGFITDDRTSESLPSAGIYKPGSFTGTISNNFGFYSITLPAGQKKLRASYVGYQAKEILFNLTSDTTINIRLNSTLELQEVSILGFHNPELISIARMGAIVLPVEDIRDVPGLLGETDLIKNIQMLPGIQGGSEGFSGLHVRGGGPDQNLILLDDVPVYNIGHLLGFLSIFNADAVKHVSVFKGGFPARYGGRLSSVIDVRMVEGNHERIKGNLNVGILSSGISLNGPVIRDKSGFALSFRRTYLDALASIIQRGRDETTNYYFFDLNGKFNHRFSPRSRLYLSAYAGRDKYFTSYNYTRIPAGTNRRNGNQVQFNDENSAGWGNLVSALRWNYLFNNRLFGNLTATYSNYRFFIGVQRNNQVNNTWETFEQRYTSGIKDFSLSADFDYYPASGNLVKFGSKVVHHLFNPGVDFIQRGLNSASPSDSAIGNLNIRGWEYHAYYENEFLAGEKWRFNLGGRLTLFKGENKIYWSAEPRVSTHFAVSPRWALRSTFSSMSQFVHLVSSSNVALPTDLWLPVTDKISPMRAIQVSVGSDRNFGNEAAYTASIDIYHKWLSNILHYRESTGFFDYSTLWEDKLTAGNGTSYGIELLLRKNRGPLTGWVGYTIARTYNKFAELNNGIQFPARFDRRHDLGLSLNYRFNENTDAGFMWQYGSGTPITLPSEKYFAPDFPFTGATGNPGYSENAVSINGFRMPAFHRLDIGFNFRKELKRGERTWSVGVINLYGRQNPFLLYFATPDATEPGTSQRQLKQLSLFPFPIPYFKYTFKF